MTHNTTVNTELFDLLKARQRHIMLKPDDYQPEDTLVVTREGTREQLTFTVVSVEQGKDSKTVNSHYCLLGLFAPYVAVDDLPLSVGGGFGAAPLPTADKLHY